MKQRGCHRREACVLLVAGKHGWPRWLGGGQPCSLPTTNQLAPDELAAIPTPPNNRANVCAVLRMFVVVRGGRLRKEEP